VPPGKKPNTSITLKHTETIFIVANIYSPRSGAASCPSPTGYSGGEDSKSARWPEVDSQKEEDRAFERRGESFSAAFTSGGWRLR
jgi:hypothetical protein